VSRKGQSITLSISDRDKAQLEEIARELGIMRGDRPNISGLVEAIARQQFLVAPNNDWSEGRIKLLLQAAHVFTDAGRIEEAQEIASLLLERSEVSAPLKEEIDRFIKNPPPPWRLEAESYSNRQQPFQISYHDAAERLWQFTVYGAQVNMHERRLYLDCWCEETAGNLDIPELQHNWSLRLDRIADAAIVPVKGEWRSHLDYVEVEMHLLRGLFFAYQAKPEDITSQQLPGERRIKRVVRKITSTFWFQREVLQYGKDCIVVSPENVRDRIKQELLAMYHNYNPPSG